MFIYPRSTVTLENSSFSLGREPGGEKVLLVTGETRGLETRGQAADGAWICPLSPANAAALRDRLPWLNPAPLGLRTSAGTGDRLGLATPGHARAALGTRIAPIFAQQSVRENARTGRTPQQVLDDALWGLFQEGWREPWGADADHLKHEQDTLPFIEAGYTFYTVDPGEHVGQAAPDESLDALRTRAAGLDVPRLRADYLARGFNLDGLELRFDEPALLRAALKYQDAAVHAASLFHFIRERMGSRPFDFEVSVDETDIPTTPLEHFFIASELRRRGVRWESLAPRFVGAFEKGVDYIGDLGELERELARHASVARGMGGYKLSLHSGSDKFSVYPLAARATRGRVHLKTAGTSYLEALRVAARLDPSLFRAIYAYSRERYPQDRASYHVSAQLERAPGLETLSDETLPGLLEQFDARQVLHVAFGSVLDRHGMELKTFLAAHEEDYYSALESHFKRHLKPFAEFATENTEITE